MKLSDIILKEELNVARRKLDKLAHDIGFEEFAKVILSLADENILDDIVDAMNFSEKGGTEYYNPDILKEENQGLLSIKDLIKKNDERVDAVAKAISSKFDIKDDGYLRGTIRHALADHI